MNDDQTSLSHAVHININKDYERRDWAKRFGVTEDELKDAVHAAGDSADKVRDYVQVKNFIKHLNEYIKHRRPPSSVE